ncbi:MAG: hypothetical protein AAGF12_40985, partial [Myxococcota bacterium]
LPVGYEPWQSFLRARALASLLGGCVQNQGLAASREPCEDYTVLEIAVDASARLRGLVGREDGFALFYVDRRELRVLELDRTATPVSEARVLGSGNRYDPLDMARTADGYRLVTERLVDGRPEILTAQLNDGGDATLRDVPVTMDGRGNKDPFVLARSDQNTWLTYRSRANLVLGTIQDDRFAPAAELAPGDGVTSVQVLGIAEDGQGVVALTSEDRSLVIHRFLADGTSSGDRDVLMRAVDPSAPATLAEGPAAVVFAEEQIEVRPVNGARWGEPVGSLPLASAPTRISATRAKDGHVRVAVVGADGRIELLTPALGARQTIRDGNGERALVRPIGSGLLVAVQLNSPARVELHRRCPHVE